VKRQPLDIRDNHKVEPKNNNSYQIKLIKDYKSNIVCLTGEVSLINNQSLKTPGVQRNVAPTPKKIFSNIKNRETFNIYTDHSKNDSYLKTESSCDIRAKIARAFQNNINDNSNSNPHPHPRSNNNINTYANANIFTSPNNKLLTPQVTRVIIIF